MICFLNWLENTKEKYRSGGEVQPCTARLRHRKLLEGERVAGDKRRAKL